MSYEAQLRLIRALRQGAKAAARGVAARKKKNCKKCPKVGRRQTVRNSSYRITVKE